MGFLETGMGLFARFATADNIHVTTDKLSGCTTYNIARRG